MRLSRSTRTCSFLLEAANARPRRRLANKLMKLSVFRSLSDPKLPGDLVAGLTLWAVLVPEALAYASIAGVSPVIGLYAAPGALILYAAFGSSRQLVVGPGAASAALSAAIVGDLVTQGSSDFVQLTATLAITVGLLAIVASVLRLGFIANFISEPVMKGFIIGLALTVIVGQLPKLFGIEKGAGDFFEQLWDSSRTLIRQARSPCLSVCCPWCWSSG